MEQRVGNCCQRQEGARITAPCGAGSAEREEKKWELPQGTGVTSETGIVTPLPGKGWGFTVSKAGGELGSRDGGEALGQEGERRRGQEGWGEEMKTKM